MIKIENKNTIERIKSLISVITTNVNGLNSTSG